MPQFTPAERETVERLCYALDLPATVYTGPERREEIRATYQRTISLRFLQADNEVLTAQAATRNLSPRGIACLHHPFAYPDCNTVVSLTGRDGGLIHIAGRMLHCRYVGHAFHSSSVLFHERIDLDHFLFEAEFGSAAAYLDQIRARHDRSERVRRKLGGQRIVVINPQEGANKNLLFLLRAAGAELLEVPYLGNALDLLRTTNVALLLCGPEHDGADAVQIVELCRSLGYRHEIVGLGWDRASLDATRALPNGPPIDAIDPGSANEILELIDRHDTTQRGSRSA